jgi:hypothetical protein
VNSTTEGETAFLQLRADNSALYPQYAREIEGIAAGAGVAVEEIWFVDKSFLICPVVNFWSCIGW